MLFNNCFWVHKTINGFVSCLNYYASRLKSFRYAQIQLLIRTAKPSDKESTMLVFRLQYYTCVKLGLCRTRLPLYLIVFLVQNIAGIAIMRLSACIRYTFSYTSMNFCSFWFGVGFILNCEYSLSVSGPKNSIIFYRH